MESLIKKLKTTVNFFKRNPVLLVPFLTGISHFFNLFGYPPIEGDEGVYVGQAWWLVKFGKITPYTYWYDHFPLGWLQIGIWQRLTGGPFVFGLSVFSGRVFVVLLACLTNVIIFLITDRITRNSKIALFASLIFAFSPLAIFYHRKVLLDNIAVFWLMLAIYNLIFAQGSLLKFFLAGLFWGIAFLSKESMAFFLPAFLVTSLALAKKENRSLSIYILFLTFFTLVSLFPLLAILKGELLPSSWFDGPPRVSFIETFFHQLKRGSKLPFWQEGSDLRFNLPGWLSQDFLLLAFGAWGMVINLLFGNTFVRFFSLFGLSYILFLIRGGLVLNFYIIPLIPFLATNVALSLDIVTTRIAGLGSFFEKRYAQLIFVFLVVCIISSRNLYLLDAIKNQKAMVNYIKKELNPNSVIITDFTSWVDLRLERFKGDSEFENVEWFYKAELDPEIRFNKLRNNIKLIDYIILTNEVVGQLNTGEYSFLAEALNSSELVVDYPPVFSGSLRDLNNLVSNDASWVTLYKLNKQNYRSAFDSLIHSL